ncbi:MAG: hypothetical protein KAS30_04780 [Candidatus Diapherotrites archaeon]|nr:hypothetical protein [Candidatus Diapherotrites archaeon]
MKENGFIISLDALIAALVLITIISISVFNLGQIDYSERNNLILKQNAMDFLTVIEKNNYLEDSIINNRTNEIRIYMNKLPNSICFDLGIYSNSDYENPVLSLLKSGCVSDFSDSATLNRSFIVRQNEKLEIYFARVTVWHK